MAMLKRFGVRFMAVALLALVAPAAAGAALMTSSPGTPMPTGTVFFSTGKNITITSSLLGSITCAKLTYHQGLTKNETSTVEAEGAVEKMPEQESCANTGHLVTVTSIWLTKFVAGSGGNTITFNATVDIKGPPEIECTFTGTKVPFTYTSGSDTITFTEAGGITSTGGCGTAKLDGSFTMEVKSTPALLD
jgi:hypothetical protein